MENEEEGVSTETCKSRCKTNCWKSLKAADKQQNRYNTKTQEHSNEYEVGETDVKIFPCNCKVKDQILEKLLIIALAIYLCYFKMRV